MGYESNPISLLAPGLRQQTTTAAAVIHISPEALSVDRLSVISYNYKAHYHRNHMRRSMSING